MAWCHTVQLLKPSVKNCLVGKATFPHHFGNGHVSVHKQGYAVRLHGSGAFIPDICTGKLSGKLAMQEQLLRL